MTGISGGATFYAALETAKKGERARMHIYARVYVCAASVAVLLY